MPYQGIHSNGKTYVNIYIHLDPNNVLTIVAKLLCNSSLSDCQKRRRFFKFWTIFFVDIKESRCLTFYYKASFKLGNQNYFVQKHNFF